MAGANAGAKPILRIVLSDHAAVIVGGIVFWRTAHARPHARVGRRARAPGDIECRVGADGFRHRHCAGVGRCLHLFPVLRFRGQERRRRAMDNPATIARGPGPLPRRVLCARHRSRPSGRGSAGAGARRAGAAVGQDSARCLRAVRAAARRLGMALARVRRAPRLPQRQRPVGDPAPPHRQRRRQRDGSDWLLAHVLRPATGRVAKTRRRAPDPARLRRHHAGGVPRGSAADPKFTGRADRRRGTATVLQRFRLSKDAIAFTTRNRHRSASGNGCR